MLKSLFSYSPRGVFLRQVDLVERGEELVRNGWPRLQEKHKLTLTLPTQSEAGSSWFGLAIWGFAAQN